MLSTVLLSGGIGSRSGKDIPKQYCDLLGKKIICYCLDSIVQAGYTHELVVVYGEGYRELLSEILKPYKKFFKSTFLVLGGRTRQESVLNGISRATGDRILLHEAARPLITSQELKAIAQLDTQAATMGLSIPFTVLKKSEGRITEVLKREELFNVQLPQVFPRKELIKAHNLAAMESREFTDDSSLFFHYIGDVFVLEGSSENIKVTDSKDFDIAESILRSRNED